MAGLLVVFSTLLFLAFTYTEGFRFCCRTRSGNGILVGLEIPLLMRILKERFHFHDCCQRPEFDYLG
jgi:spermidine synthase